MAARPKYSVSWAEACVRSPTYLRWGLEAFGSTVMFSRPMVAPATTAITGACLALRRAIERLQLSGKMTADPLRSPVAAISVGLVNNEPLLDLNYPEDRDAQVDMNVVMTGKGRLVEVQAGGEEHDFSREEFQSLLNLAEKGLQKVFAFQEQAWKSRPTASPIAPPEA